jgi:hypothetical protein
MNYFQHDTDATNDPKIIALLGKCGGLGYGIFWRIVEILHKEPEHKIEKENYFFDGLAQQMSTDVQQILTVVNTAISYKIFYEDEKYIWSKRVFKNFEERNKVIESKRKAGLISAQKRTSVEQVLTGVEQVSTNKEKKNKEKEIKEEKIKDIKEMPTKQVLPTRADLLEIYKNSAKEVFKEKRITLNEFHCEEKAEEFCDFWLGNSDIPGEWYTNKKYHKRVINPKSTAKNNIIKYNFDYMANYDIPFEESLIEVDLVKKAEQDRKDREFLEEFKAKQKTKREAENGLINT